MEFINIQANGSYKSQNTYNIQINLWNLVINHRHCTRSNSESLTPNDIWPKMWTAFGFKLGARKQRDWDSQSNAVNQMRVWRWNKSTPAAYRATVGRKYHWDELKSTVLADFCADTWALTFSQSRDSLRIVLPFLNLMWQTVTEEDTKETHSSATFSVGVLSHTVRGLLWDHAMHVSFMTYMQRALCILAAQVLL